MVFCFLIPTIKIVGYIQIRNNQSINQSMTLGFYDNSLLYLRESLMV